MDSEPQHLHSVDKRRSCSSLNSTSTAAATCCSTSIGHVTNRTAHSRSPTPHTLAQAQAQAPPRHQLHAYSPPPSYSKLKTKSQSAVALDARVPTSSQLHFQQPTSSSVHRFASSGPGSPHVHVPLANFVPPSSFHLDNTNIHMRSDNDVDTGDMIWTGSSPSPRGRSYTNERLRLISTDPTTRGAGETETELDEPPHRLPTSRKPPSRTLTTTPFAPIPILFQIFRLLSVVPAIAGTLYHVYTLSTYESGSNPSAHCAIDHLICILWALLTAHQCLFLTTGLLLRWKAYYPPLPTLIRLLALQAICWPATQFTLVLLDHAKRPVVCWAVIGSTTCVSRAVQIWVTSNLWSGGGVGGGLFGADRGSVLDREKEKKGKSRMVDINRGMSWLGGVGGGEGWGEEWRKWGPRRWDWTEVGLRCALPAGVVYFVMAWGLVLGREFGGC